MLTLDDAKTLRGRFKPSPAAEREFYRQLKKIAVASGHVIERHADGARIHDDRAMLEELKRYSDKLTPWAARQAQKMLEKVARSNKSAYTKKSKAIGLALKHDLAETSVGQTAQLLLNSQVELIRSIPLESGLRAQKIAYDAFLLGTRAEANADTIRELEEQMGFSTKAAVSRAMLIARTETARANAAINQARAEAVGSGQYRWHNSGDGAVRDSHRMFEGKKLQGRVFSWDDPPLLDDGMRGHPGTFPNCRCFAEPIFENE